jgi:uroporphyrinogen decarboxylase
MKANSKERVLTALKHQTPDRVPAARCHGFWESDVRQALFTHFKVRNEETLDVLLNLDVKWVEPFYRGPDMGYDKDNRKIGIWGMAEGEGTYSEKFHRPLGQASTVQEVEDHPWPKVEWFDFSLVKTSAELVQEFAVVAPPAWSPIFSRISGLCGFETALMMLHTAPTLIEAMVERITAFNVEFYSELLDAGKGLIDILIVGDDPAGQDRMLMNPDLWRRFFKPSLKSIFEVAKSRGVYVMYHICGNCREILPDLIEIGLDILNPLQISARDMDPIELKNEFGKDLSFWGGVDVQSFLPTATPDEVRHEVRRLIDILGKDGGYVLSSSHNLLIDVSVENIIAMYDVAVR